MLEVTIAGNKFSRAAVLNLSLVGSMLSVTQSCVARGDICNPSPGKAEIQNRTPKQIWKFVTCLFMETFIALLVYFSEMCLK
jgi:hypothetical protein